VVAATRLVRGGQNNRVPVLTIPTLAAVAYAYWKNLTPTFTIALMIGQVGKPLNDPTDAQFLLGQRFCVVRWEPLRSVRPRNEGACPQCAFEGAFHQASSMAINLNTVLLVFRSWPAASNTQRTCQTLPEACLGGAMS